MQEWVSIYETNECDIGTPDITGFRRLMCCQRDPLDRGVTDSLARRTPRAKMDLTVKNLKKKLTLL